MSTGAPFLSVEADESPEETITCAICGLIRYTVLCIIMHDYRMQEKSLVVEKAGNPLFGRLCKECAVDFAVQVLNAADTTRIID